MRVFPAFLVLFGLLAPLPSAAQSIAYEAVDLDANPAPVGGERNLPTRWVSSAAAPRPQGIASYGPFRVLDERRAALIDVTDGRSPGQFAAMLRDHPGIAVIDMIECPGTEDDLANLALGRMIRQQGISTHVPEGGSVRSGGVELFLAGAHRFADPGAEFAVHSWQDDGGREASDYAASAPENRRYLHYYQEMGMSPIEAEAFYAMTNSAPFDSAKWFGTGTMGLWVDLDPNAPASAPPQAVALTLAPPSSNGARL